MGVEWEKWSWLQGTPPLPVYILCRVPRVEALEESAFVLPHGAKADAHHFDGNVSAVWVKRVLGGMG